MSGGPIHPARLMALALAAPALLLLGACSADEAADENAANVAVNQTVKELLAEDSDLSRTAALIERTGLGGVLDAAPSYTLLAPTDEALGTLDPASDADAADNPAMAALLRGHILPGYVVLDDIVQAIDASEDGQVTMQTMAQTPLTFTRDGDVVTVTAADGTSTTIAGPGKHGGNGVILPVNGLLKTL